MIDFAGMTQLPLPENNGSTAYLTTDFVPFSFAAALSSMDLSEFEPAVDPEASDKACRISSIAALSRRKPIQDAADFWAPRRESADSSVTAPAQDSHNVDT
jgi:hypothetical protein